MINKLILLMLVFVGAVSISASGCEEDHGAKVYERDIAGRSYYFFEEGYICRAFAPGAPYIKSWRDRIEFLDGKVLVWQSLCNDNPIQKEFDSSEFKFSDDLESFIYKGNEYQYHQIPPDLCVNGQWCPVDEE
ncbi:hypothetical protein [uncultured Endozoicomonas sp.]|uniref:hypothetical protein n=1 Tax=uncultured Endozoicomonas sp. TaxID=432652 RepID=UPI00262E79EB|nr:hypothetical protein [uncultured Endozoicomonas sp.]